MSAFHQRRYQLPFVRPAPVLNIALIEPEIPPNTGNIARLCAATGTTLHLVGPTGFRLNNPALRRAGLDYWASVDLRRHSSLEQFMPEISGKRFFLFSTAGKKTYTSVSYRPGDYLVFGSESRGLPDDLLANHPALTLGIPMQSALVRSLNLASAAAIVLYEALRQICSMKGQNGFPESSAQTSGNGAAKSG
ncbi:MAG: tRNA (cytidine(34)-2'-O)-methyltransferase [Kiritimatiellae bacterium]|nr:tRNA (cytidine(34)-2'-O)-methyltransferase [Kiritimatiellia bacterium]